MEKMPKGLSTCRRDKRLHTRGEGHVHNEDVVNRSIQLNHHAMRIAGPGQPVLQGYKRQVQGFNGLNPAQLGRPWGSTQIVPSEHNRTQRSWSDGRASARGIAHIPTVVSREGMIWLPSEKDQNCKAIHEGELRREHREAGCSNHCHYYYHNTTNRESSRSGVDGETGKLPLRNVSQRSSIASSCGNLVNPAGSWAEGEDVEGVMQKLIESREGTEPHGVAVTRKEK